MFCTVEAIPLLTAADGTAKAFSRVVNGHVLSIRLIVPQADGLAATSDLTITNERTGDVILTLGNQNGSGTWAPRQATHTTAGAAAVYAAGGAPVLDLIPIAEGRIQVEVAQGGAVKGGILYVTIGGA